MIKDNLIKDIMNFCEAKVKELIAELQKKRFENQGQFNDHKKWVDNHPLVIQDKHFNEPLVDSGNLMNELTNPNNWDINPTKSGMNLKLTIPDMEEFTDKKYDKLDTGGKTEPYISPRGNKMNIRSVPARPFKSISQTDAKWIVEKLVEAIKMEYAA